MTPFPLGRKVNHDPRSLNFPALTSTSHNPVLWRHYGPVLDQGNVGSCTGNAMAQTLNTKPFHVSRAKLLTEADAVSIYSAATALDGTPGSYPPDDTGSDGLSVAKVAQSRGLITGYSHAFGLDHALGALQISPVLLGIAWHQSMFTPDSKGFVHPDGNVVGGHEICILGDDGKGAVKLLNSWGMGWGLNGYFRLSYADLDSLLQDQGDVTVPVK